MKSKVTIANWLKRFGLMLAAVIISLLIRENYPFSHNPMYSKFDPYTYFLHVTDENDNVLIFRKEFGHSAIRLKKVFSTKFKKLRKGSKTKDLPKEEHLRLAGEDTLLQYHAGRKPKTDSPTAYTRLKLIRTDIELVPGDVKEVAVVIAEINVDPVDLP